MGVHPVATLAGGRPVAGRIHDVPAVLDRFARWLPLVACLALGAFGLGVLVGSLQAWSPTTAPVSSKSPLGTLNLLVEESSALPEARSEPRLVRRVALSQNHQPRSAARSGDWRAFLMQALVWTHGPRPATGWATRFYAPASKYTAESKTCEEPSPTQDDQHAPRSMMLADAMRAPCGPSLPE